jgi:hypothetical protein
MPRRRQRRYDLSHRHVVFVSGELGELCSNGPLGRGVLENEQHCRVCARQSLSAHAAQSDLAVCDCLLVCVLFVSLCCVCVCIVLWCGFVLLLCVLLLLLLGFVLFLGFASMCVVCGVVVVLWCFVCC